MHVARRIASLSAGALLGVSGLVGIVGFGAGPASAACGSDDLSAGIKHLTLSPSTGVRPGKDLKVSFDGALPDGSCAGDFVTFAIPTLLHGETGTYDVLDPAGISLGEMVVSEHAVKITFNSYVEHHHNVTFHGWFESSVDWSIHPSTTYPVGWSIGPTTHSTPFATASCDGCADVVTQGSKDASYDAANHVVESTLTSGSTRAAGEVVTFTDVMGPGQSFRCDSLHASVWSAWDEWGYSRGYSTNDFKVLKCDTNGFTVTMTSPKVGQYLAVGGSADVTADRSSYTDSGTIAQHGDTTAVDASAAPAAAGPPAPSSGASNTARGGAGGDGDNQQAATVPPTASSTPSSAPSSTPTSTPSPTTPSTPSATATSTPSLAPSETPAATPTATPHTTRRRDAQGKRDTAAAPTPGNALPNTGAPDVAIVATIGVVLVSAGVLLVAGGRRRRR